MFQGCSELEYLDLSNFNTSNVIDMTCIFNGCKKLLVINGIDNFNTIKVITMEGIFQECNNLKYLDFSNFNTSNTFNMVGMFNQYHKLKEIKGINIFITAKTLDIHSMFSGCNDLEKLDLTNFDTTNINSMKLMFNDYYKLKEIIGINHFNTINVKEMRGMFQ